ncbi:MAG: hypothetical protein RLZZ626_695 [Actinomycetota bacterium]|jgi:uncharacterized protein YggU (UPF0235/DUF167 family)
MQISVAVKPGSRKGPLIESQTDGSLLVYLRSRAVEGAANKELIEILAVHFGVAKSLIEIVGGATARIKRVVVDI